MTNDHLTELKNQLKYLPERPGVYEMFNAQGEVIYIGKAKSLKKRLSSYFRGQLPIKTSTLMEQVVDIKTTVTQTEVEALLTEANLIKEYQPRYNVLLRDDKSYPYLFLSEHEFPRLDFHRGAKKYPGQYFGPYPSAGSVRQVLAMIQKLFKLRQCQDSFFYSRTRPCLQYQIKRCTAPCVGYVNKENYAEQVKLALLFLKGKDSQIIDDLSEKMIEYSNDQEYEKAAHCRDQLIMLRKVQTPQTIIGDVGDIDIMSIAEKMGQMAISVLFIRAGRFVGNRTYFPKVPVHIEKAQALAEFIPQYYLSPARGELVVQRVVVTEQIPDRLWIEKALYTQLEQKMVISDRKHSHYEQWRALAYSNAEQALETYLAKKIHILEQLQELQRALQLPNLPQRIECFDVSHTRGEATVASCVVFNEEGPVKKDYRHFNIENIVPGDDYAAIRQALTRRYAHLKARDGKLPDLLIIDGGKGQLSQAAAVLEELQVPGVCLLGIAKGPERKPGLEQLYLWGREHPIHLDHASAALHLLQFIRDEAHRFAITAHRAKISKKRKQSPLEGIPGVGPKKRQQLLRHFGGWQEIKNASVIELMKVKGISQELAKKIYSAIHSKI